MGMTVYELHSMRDLRNEFSLTSVKELTQMLPGFWRIGWALLFWR